MKSSENARDDDEGFKPNWKPSRTARKLAERQTKLDRRALEDGNKRKVRARDRGCRFPLCGCRKLGLPLEVSHNRHKGMGGNPSGDRSTTAGMVQMCQHRHQFGAISRHNGTLQAVPITDRGMDGPAAWQVDQNTIWASSPSGWITIARESAIGVLEPLEAWQRSALERLALMEL